MLSGKEKRYLRGKASVMNAVVIVGKDGLSSNLIKSLNDALEAHELVKVSILKTCDLEVREVALDLAGACNAQIVQTIGRVIVFYRRTKKNLMGL